jgi:hypothetical protein
MRALPSTDVKETPGTFVGDADTLSLWKLE